MEATVKLMTRSALVDFMEGAVGIITDWPTMVPEGYHIEVILPKLAGRVEGRPIAEEVLSDTDIIVIAPSMVDEVAHYLNLLIKGEERTFATLHRLDDGRFRTTLWEHKKPEIRKTEKDH